MAWIYLYYIYAHYLPNILFHAFVYILQHMFVSQYIFSALLHFAAC